MKEENYKILLVVDAQNDFIEGGSLAVSGGKKALNNLIEWIEKNNPGQVILTRDKHPKNHCSFKSNGGLWPEHCVNGTEGFRFYKPLVLALNDGFKVLSKGTEPEVEEYSILSDTCEEGEVLKKYLSFFEKDKKIDIYVAGIAGDYCVLNTIKDLIKLNFGKNIIVLQNSIASIDGGKTLSDFIQENGLKSE